MNLQEYLKKHNASPELLDLMAVFTGQVEKIKEEFSGGGQKTGIYNVYGEEEIKIDKKANEILLKACRESGLVKSAGSEEEEEVINMDSNRGHFGVTLDPLDGSSLIPTNLAVGTIVSLYENGDIMSGLRHISQSFYFLFGPLSLLVFADKHGVTQFIYNSHRDTFDLVKENIRLPEGNLYSPGGLKTKWHGKHAAYIAYLEEQGFKLRYSGSFVPDFHQILTYGGIFSYPALLDKPAGKLRLLFEVGPMAFIAEQAGGAAIDGQQAVLDMIPDKVDQRTAVYIGSKKVVEQAQQMLSNNN